VLVITWGLRKPFFKILLFSDAVVINCCCWCILRGEIDLSLLKYVRTGFAELDVEVEELDDDDDEDEEVEVADADAEEDDDDDDVDDE
jgi:hypothetical protein